jgi:hypothetical protein
VQHQLRLTRTAEHEVEEPVAAKRRKTAAGARFSCFTCFTAKVQILTPEELLKGGRNKKSAALDSGSDDEVFLCWYFFVCARER